MAARLCQAPLTSPPRANASNAVYVNIRGYQWAWAYTFPRLPGLSISQGDLHLPLHRDADWRVTSSDVVHDWWAPALDGHMDAYPNHVEHSVIYTSSPGTFYAQCSKFCGLYHWKMHNNVVVEAPVAFARWALRNGAQRRDLARLFPGDATVTTALALGTTRRG